MKNQSNGSEVGAQAALAAMKFALDNKFDEGMQFLECWYMGNFEAIHKEWPEAPEAVFIGADPLHGKRKPTAAPKPQDTPGESSEADKPKMSAFDEWFEAMAFLIFEQVGILYTDKEAVRQDFKAGASFNEVAIRVSDQYSKENQ